VEQKKETRKRTWRRDPQQPTRQSKKAWTLREFGGKTLWDWLQLLIVPVVLSLITVVFAWQQDIRQDQIENKRAAAERELAKERAQDEALQAYLDQMSGLLLERDLRTSEKGSEVRTLARARTLTALQRLDPSRKTVVMQFLVEADLVQGVDGREPVINLSGADLGDANLSGAWLGGYALLAADLGIAKPGVANLPGADLSEADLSEADLSGAKLSGANLSEADLSNADLSDAVGITNEELEQQVALPWLEGSLEGATMPNGQKYEDWLKSKGSSKD
jgi:uncharacterized protein YjbI with pentapeptide repeats